MSIWTLAYTAPGGGTTEKALSDWGILEGFARTTANKVKGTVSLTTTEGFDPAGGAQFAAKGFAQIWRDRTALGAGGTLWHQGWFDDPVMRTEGGKQYVDYQLHDLFWKFELNGFCQERSCITGFTGGLYSAPVYTTFLASETYLHEDPNGLRKTNGWEIGEICDWINEVYNPTKRGATAGRDNTQDLLVKGTIEPAVYAPVTRVNSLLCSEAVLAALRLSPDSVIYVDVDGSTGKPRFNVRTVSKWNYGTVPPTFIDYTNLPEVTVNIRADQEAQIRLQGQQTKRLPAVIIFYLANQTLDGFTVPSVVTDVWPVASSLWTPEAGRFTVEMEGASVSEESAAVVVAPITDLTAGSPSAQVAWWKTHDRSLQDSKIDAATIVVGTPTIVDDSGATVNLTTYPNELLTPLPEWIGASVIKATVCADVAFTRYADAALHIPDVKPVTRSMRKTIRLTNAASGTYSAVTSATSGDPVPQGVAEAVFRGLDLVQWAGSIRFAGGQARSDIYIGCRLKLVGPTTTFTNVIPQRIRETPHFGYVDVEYGPCAPPDVDTLVDISRSVRGRTTYRMPSGRASGGFPAGSLDQNATRDLDDTSHGPGGNKFLAETFVQVP